MLPSGNCKKIKIYITTFSNKKKTQQEGQINKEGSLMCSQSRKKDQKDHIFVCPLCLTEQPTEDMNVEDKSRRKIKNRKCPFCQKERNCITDAFTCTELRLIDFNEDMECVCQATDTGGCQNEQTKKDVERKTVTNRNNNKIKDREYTLMKKQSEDYFNVVATNIKTNSILENDDNFSPAGKAVNIMATKNKTNLILENYDNLSPPGKAVDNEAGKNKRMYYKIHENDESPTISGKTIKDDDNDERPRICCKLKKENLSKRSNRFCSGPCQIGDVDSRIVNCEETKMVETQTSKTQIDLNNGFNLLNEVLTVFQNKKCEPKSCDCRLNLDCKDASIQATEGIIKKNKSLSLSKLVKYSISEEKTAHNQPRSSFIILESRQPDINKSKSSMHLAKYKSSSIPQMKLEELKYSMKEKTKSKDTVDEVNRMFAVVGKYDRESKDDSNRPAVRSGPRILPVVKTGVDYKTKEMKDNFSEMSGSPQLQDTTCTKLIECKDTKDNYSEVSVDREIKYIKSCKKCQTSDFYMSGGDSKESCSGGVEEIRCEKCVYMLSCPCRHNRPRAGMVICECCKKRNKGCKCSRESCLMAEEFLNSTNF